MLKKIEELGNLTQLNKSGLRTARAQLLESYPLIADYIDDILPRKAVILTTKVKSEHKLELFIIENEVLFFEKEKKLIPTLRLLHKYPYILPKMQIDKGGLKYIFGGANVMAPGLTSPGGKMDDVEENQIVGIYAEGKEHALAIGSTLMSTKKIREVNKGHAIETLHHLNDGLWTLKEFKK